MAGPARATPSTSTSRHEEYKVQPPRPPNSWILYRSHQSALIRQNNSRMLQSDVSKRVSDMWKAEKDSVRRHYEKLAEEAKLKHQERYPDYRFNPQKKEEKLRSKEGNKTRRVRKVKARDATPADAPVPAPTSMSATPALPLIPTIHPSRSHPSPMPIPNALSHLLETHFGSCGPSPPISVAPSPALHEAPQLARSSSDETISSCSSSPPIGSSPSSESQESTSQSSANQYYIPSLPTSHHPSPNGCTIESLPNLLQSSPPGEQPSNLSLASSDWTVAPQATVSSYANEEAPKPSLPVMYTLPYTVSRTYTGNRRYGSHQFLPWTRNQNGVFNLTNIDTDNIMVHPPGELDITMGVQAPTVDYNGQLFSDYDFFEFQKQMASFTEAGSTSLSPVAIGPPGDELESLFNRPNGSEVEAYAIAQQRQPSAFTQDMMSYLNFDAIEGSAEDTSAVVSSLPIPTTIAPQQVLLDDTQHTVAMSIFTHMTNSPTAVDTPASSYMPSAGASNSSARRVGGSWKPPFVMPGETEDSVHSWAFPTN